MSRLATHAGSWYHSNKARLNSDLEKYLNSVPPSKPGVYESLPVPGARFLVGPHAGYAYAGQTLAETYKAFDISHIERIFILGPSHHVYFKGAMLTGFHSYETPLGNIPVDTETIDELNQTGFFKTMSKSIDEDEHSFEMHLPLLYKVTQGTIPIIPILVGSTTMSIEKELAKILAPYFQDKSNAFVISTDFCHWGSRFDYMSYTDSHDANKITDLNYGKLGKVPIYKSIEYLDKLGMKVASTGSYHKFNDYMKQTENTICGRKPLAIVLKASEDAEITTNLKWIGYSQSSKVIDTSDSSVSYASGFAVC